MRYLLGDTETCSFSGPDETSSGVVNAAYLELDEHANVLARANSLIDPQREIGADAMAVHGITEDMVRGMPHWHVWFPAVWAPGPTVFIAHNAPFDLKFYGPHIDILHGTICTLVAARRYIKNTSNHKLQTLAEELGLEKGAAHRAEGDVVTNLALLKYIMALTGKTLHQLMEEQRAAKMLTVMPFGKHKGEIFVNLPAHYLQWVLAQGEDMPADVRFSAKQALNAKGIEA